jgi:hypothetical protein
LPCAFQKPKRRYRADQWKDQQIWPFQPSAHEAEMHSERRYESDRQKD